MGYERIKEWRQRTKTRAVMALGGKCVLCNYNRCLSALEFHHLDPSQKNFSFSGYHICRWEDIVEELRKCVLVCANCHREVESNMVNIDTAQIPSFDESFALLEPRPTKIHPNRVCENPQCGKEYSPNGPTQKFCSMVCAKSKQRKVKFRPSKDTLQKLLETMSYEAVGRKYRVSGNAVRKWLK